MAPEVEKTKKTQKTKDLATSPEIRLSSGNIGFLGFFGFLEFFQIVSVGAVR